MLRDDRKCNLPNGDKAFQEEKMLQSATIEYKHEGHLCEGFAVWEEAGENDREF